MLTNISLTNFKCFQEFSRPLKPLTILSGFNASGKSTVLQGVLLPVQGVRSSHKNTTLLPLNGSLLRLGTPGEVFHSGSNEATLSIKDRNSLISWTLTAQKNNKNRSSMEISQIIVQENNSTIRDRTCKQLHFLLPKAGDIPNARHLINTLSETIFLGATRPATTDVFPSPDETQNIHANVGVQGEFAPWWYDQCINTEIETGRCHPTGDAATLQHQFQAWAGKLFPGAEAHVIAIEGTNLVRLHLRITPNGEWRRPANIGYGLTYAFPIFIAGLLAKQNQILIIDSPEAHLHPMGQSYIGQFLAVMASQGVQVILETHSDHVLNGVRLAVHKQKIDPNHVALHFFQALEPGKPKVPPLISPQIDQNGNLSEWPTGFCDQAETDTAKLLGWE